MKRRRCSITKKEYYAGYVATAPHLRQKKKPKNAFIHKVICKPPLPNNASSSSPNASILEATSVIPNEHVKPCTTFTGLKKKKRIDSLSNIGENEKSVKLVLKKKVSGLSGSQKSNFKQIEKKSPVANGLDDEKENLTEIGKKSELEEGEISGDPDFTILIQETYSKRMESILQKQKNQYEKFKSFLETEELKIKSVMESESRNSVHGQLCPQHPSCKITAFTRHFKSEKKKLSLSFIQEREKERQLKDKWLSDAKVGELVMPFDAIPLSCSEFEPETFKEDICQGEITGCKQSNLNDAFKERVPCQHVKMLSFPHKVPPKTTCESSALTLSALSNQVHAKDYNRSTVTVYDGVGREEEKSLPSQTLSCKHPIASSTGIVMNSSGSKLQLTEIVNSEIPQCKTDAFVDSTHVQHSSDLLRSTCQSLKHGPIRTVLAAGWNEQGPKSPKFMVCKMETTLNVNSEVPLCNSTGADIDSIHAQSSPLSSTFLNEKELTNASVREGIFDICINVERVVNNHTGSTNKQKGASHLHLTPSNLINPLPMHEHSPDHLQNESLGIQKEEHFSTQIHEKLTDSELKEKIKRIKGTIIAMDKLPDIGSKLQITLKKLEEEQIRRQMLAMPSLEHGRTRAVLARVENDQGSESPHFLVHKIQSTEITNSEIPLCSSIGVDSTHAQLSPSSSTDSEQVLCKDPVQNELMRIQKEEDSAAQLHGKMTMLLKTTYECKLENLRKKYEAKRKADDETYLAKKKEFAEIKNTLLRNQILANSFSDFVESNGTAENPGSPTIWLSSSMMILQDTNGERADGQFSVSLHNQNATSPSTIDVSAPLSTQSPVTNRNGRNNSRPISQTLEPNPMSTGRMNIMQQRRGSRTAPNGSQFKPI